MPLSNKGKSRLLGMNTEALTPYLVEIYNEDYGYFRYCNVDGQVTYENNVYTPAYFQIEPPEKTESGIGNAKITISAVDQEWIARIRGTQKRSTMRLIPCVIYEDGGSIEVESVDDVHFKLTAAEWNDTTISWEMEYDDVMQINIPCDVADSLNMAGCT